MSSPSKKLLSTGKARPRSVYDGTMALPGWSSELLEIEQQTTRLLEKTRSRPATKNTLRSIDQQGTREIQRDRKKKKKKKKKKKGKAGGQQNEETKAEGEGFGAGTDASYSPVPQVVTGKFSLESLEDLAAVLPSFFGLLEDANHADLETLDRLHGDFESALMQVKSMKESVPETKVGADICIVCKVNKKSALFMPCRHLCACDACAKHIETQKGPCPQCKQKCKRIIKEIFTDS
mmetsp:Transcript_7427/g.11794  ORF Transcript_7427/g.11794 Transcript_7427/m.11794 type:complete len:235 (+) Transcript_7427:72-776(+)